VGIEIGLARAIAAKTARHLDDPLRNLRRWRLGNRGA
jgi:hypothetical protein